MPARAASGHPPTAAWLLAAMILAASLARADDGLPPGFTADPNNPFKDGDTATSSSTNATTQQVQVKVGGQLKTVAIHPPLRDEADGAPIDSSQTVNATLSYVDQEVQLHMKIRSYPVAGYGYYRAVSSSALIQQGLAEAMVPVVAKFGVANLRDAIRLKPSPRTDYDAVDKQLTGYEMNILKRALALASRTPPVPTTNPAPTGN